MSNVLLDKQFLKQLDEWPQREIYIKIISLDFAENPRAEIQGVATGGSINVDGSSAVRRTCSLNLVTENQHINEFDWALESKFKVEIGLKNFINSNYEDIIWFPQGVYIITSFSSSLNTQGFTIAIQGKDKMCLLDGSVGGNIFASHDFGKLEIRIGDTIELEPILIYDIIKNAIHEYALEPYENIIINDLEDCSVELLEYRVKDKSAIIYQSSELSDTSGWYDNNIAFQGNQILKQFAEAAKGEPLKEGTKIEQENEINDILSKIPENSLTIIDEVKKIQHTLNKYTSYGDTIGYRLTDLTYPTGQDLILAAGSSITQMLDALIKMLGEFEYFYDLEGRFVFQRKKIYYNVSWTNAITTERETYYDSIENGSANFYEFTKGVLIESYNNKPNITNIKNDYTIWGNMIGVSGTELPVHLRCAIDNKPTYYYPLLTDDPSGINPNGSQLWATEQTVIINEQEYEADVVCDWRELIYRMAYDYMKSDTKIFELEQAISSTENVDILNQKKQELLLWKKTWDTRYLAYYTDLLDFWRLLYNNNLNVIEINSQGKEENIQNPWVDNQYWNPNYVNCVQKYNYYFVGKGNGKYTFNDKLNNYIDDENGDYDRVFSHNEINIINHTSIPFWLDFCDDTYLEKYTPDKIGRRTKVINDPEIKAIFFEGTPNVLFIDPTKTTPYTDSSLSYVRLNLVGSMANYFSISTQGKSAKETLDSLLYTHTYYNESITLNCIPIYYLEPNVRISVYDKTSGINGDYIIKSYSVQLAYNGSMSITATKAEDLIL